MRLFGKVTHFLHISRCLSYNAPICRPNRLLHGSCKQWKKICSNCVCWQPPQLVDRLPSVPTLIHIQLYSQSQSGVFNVTPNVDMLRKRISFSGTPSETPEKIAPNVVPVGIILPDAKDGKQLKIVVVPMDLANQDVESLRNTLEALNQLRKHSSEIDAFTNSMMEDFKKEKGGDEVEQGSDKPKVNYFEGYIQGIDAVGSTAGNKPSTEPLVAKQEAVAFANIATEADVAPKPPTGPHTPNMPISPGQTPLSPHIAPSTAPQPMPNSMPLGDPKEAQISANAEPSLEEAIASIDPNVNQISIEVPESLSQRLNDMAISSMQLSFEMDMTNVRDAILHGEEVSRPEISLGDDAMVYMETNVEADPNNAPVNTVPLRFNALIRGTVQIDATQLNMEHLSEEHLPEYNDKVTSIAANICSTALQRGFGPELQETTPTSADAIAAPSVGKEKAALTAPKSNSKISAQARLAMRRNQAQKRMKVGHSRPTMSAFSVPDMKDGCKYPIIKPKKKCPKKCPLIDDPCKEDKCKRPKQPKKKGVKTVEITAKSSSGSKCSSKKDPCGTKGKDKKKKDPCAKFKKGGDKKKDPCGKKGGKGDKKKDPCAKFKKGGDKKTDPCAKKGGKGDKKKDPCAKFKKGGDKKNDPCAKKGGKGDKKKDPCAKVKKCAAKKKDPCGKKGGKGNKKKDPCAKFKKGGDKKKDPCAKKGGKGDKKKDPCAKFKKGGDKKNDPCAKKGGKGDKKNDPCAKFKKGGDKKKDPCGKKGGKGDKKKDPCAKFKKAAKSKKDPCKKKYSTFANPVSKFYPNGFCFYKRPMSTVASQANTTRLRPIGSTCLRTSYSTLPATFAVYSTLQRRHYGGMPSVTQMSAWGIKSVDVRNQIQRGYSKKSKKKKKKQENSKCNALINKSGPKNRKHIKARTSLRTDCYDPNEQECPKNFCSGRCGEVKIPRKMCDKKKRTQKTKMYKKPKKKLPTICFQMKGGSSKKKSKDKERNKLLSPGLLTFHQMRMHSVSATHQRRSISLANEAVVTEENPNSMVEIIRIPASYQICKECVPRPVLKPFDVLIKTGSIALTGSDIHVFENANRSLEGMTLGHDATGFVEKVGSCVHNLHVGDRVVVESALSCGICDYCKQGKYNICTDLIYNGFLATHQSHPADLCHRLPDNITMEEGTLTQTLAMGCHACYKAQISPTSNVLIFGNSSMAVSAAMCAMAIGAKKVTIAGTMGGSLEMINKDFGFNTIHFDSNALFGEVLEAIYSKFQEWPNCAINCAISPMTMNLCVMALQPCSVCVLAECESECASFNALDVLMKNIRLIPSFRSANMYPTALQLMKSGRAQMQKFIARTFSWGMLQEAFECAQHEYNVGLRKVIINTEEINIGGLRKR